ncbi:MAG: hypothetical protein ACTSU5_10425 [Promethearchaeota archaeon]
MLDWKKRIVIVLAVLLVPGTAGIVNQVAIVVEGPLDLNVKEAYFFQEPYYARYEYDPGNGSSTNVEVRSEVVNATHSKGTVLVGGVVQGTFLAEPKGVVYEDGVAGGNYSTWFVFIPNPMLAINAFKGGDSLGLVDPTGFFGAPGQHLHLRAERKFVYWPYEHSQDRLLGAQASVDALITDDAGDEVGRAIVDGTCGLPFEWHWTAGGKMQSLKLLDTNFPISRNRLNLMLFSVIFGVLLVASAAFLTRKQWDEGSKLAALNLPADERGEVLVLLATGVVAMVMEIVDIWFYLPLGLVGNVLVHAAFAAWVLFVCIHQDYGTRWFILAFLEIAYVIAMQFVDVSYVPTLTANMGSTLAWLALVWASGIEKHVDSDASGLAKAVGAAI